MGRLTSVLDHLAFPVTLLGIVGSILAGCFIVDSAWLRIAIGGALLCVPLAVAVMYFDE